VSLDLRHLRKTNSVAILKVMLNHTVVLQSDLAVESRCHSVADRALQVGFNTLGIDGYHRICAACHADEDAPVAVVLVRL
jgi:hypothetical protein